MIQLIISLFTGKFKLWAYVGVFFAIVSVFSGVYLKGRMDCNASWRAYHEKQLKKALAGSKKIVGEDSSQAAADGKDDAAFEERTRKLQDGLQDPDRECLSDDDARGVRGLWDN